MKLLLAVPALVISAGLAVAGAEAKPARHGAHRQLVWPAPAKVGANLQRICERTKSGRHCFEISKRADRARHAWRFKSQRPSGYR